jgi:hypothetical protein
MLAALGDPQAAQPVPSPAPSSSLREIGHVKAVTEFCRTALDHTNASILLLLENDRRIGDVQNTLRTNDFDASEISRGTGLRQLSAEYVALRAAAVTGNGQMALLREQIKESPSGDQRAALLQLEEALDGALTRQKRLADRIGRMIAYLESNDRIDPDTRRQEEFDALLSMNDRDAVHDPEGPLANLPWSLDEVAKAADADIGGWAVQVRRDEDDASDRLDAAFAGCL